MQEPLKDKTLGEIAAGIGRYKAQIIPLAIVLIVALFFEGIPPRRETASPLPIADSSRTAAGAHTSVGASDGSFPEVFGSDSGFGLDDALLLGDTFPGDAASGTSPGQSQPVDPDAPAPPAADPVFVCEDDASLPMPVLAPLVQQLYAAQKQAEEAAGPLPVDITAYLSGAIGCSPGTDPLGLIVAQLDPLIAALAPALDVLRTVNPLLPAIPVPPAVNVPPLPAGADPVLAAAEPATSEVCGQLAIVLLVSVVGSSLPLPFTGQHYSAITGPLFAVCAAVRPQP